MPSFTRVEFSVGPSLKSRRVVLLLEFPDEVLEQIHKRKSGSEVEAYPIALEAAASGSSKNLDFKRLSIPRIKRSVRRTDPDSMRVCGRLSLQKSRKLG